MPQFASPLRRDHRRGHPAQLAPRSLDSGPIRHRDPRRPRRDPRRRRPPAPARRRRRLEPPHRRRSHGHRKLEKTRWSRRVPTLLRHGMRRKYFSPQARRLLFKSGPMQIEHSEFQDQLVRGLAHRMNNILTLFHGYLGLLMDNQKLDKETPRRPGENQGRRARRVRADGSHALARPPARRRLARGQARTNFSAC